MEKQQTNKHIFQFFLFLLFMLSILDILTTKIAVSEYGNDIEANPISLHILNNVEYPFIFFFIVKSLSVIYFAILGYYTNYHKFIFWCLYFSVSLLTIVVYLNITTIW